MLAGFRALPARAVSTLRLDRVALASTSLDETPRFGIDRFAQRRPGVTRAGLARATRSLPWAICLITAVAALLRFIELDDVAPNQFYDAAVRSMSLSWHNFFFGALDPGAFLSIDKPPLDLWLQVASVKLFGWNSAALKLPEALGGTLAVPLLYDAIRQAVSKPAGLAAAMALAVLPESVITSRSDTMDSLMMLLVVGALWLTIRAARSGKRRFVVLAGAALGLAFNVKLLEALIAAPALVALYVVGSSAKWTRKLADAAIGGASMVAVGLCWVVAASVAPGRHPIPVGSTDGTVWNVIFVFNGFGRVSRTYPPRVGGPGLLRLVERSPWQFNLLLGCMLIAALALGAAATLAAIGRPRSIRGADRGRMPLAVGVALFVWIALAVALFDHVALLHARYFEAVAPAVAAAIGFGAASLAGLHGDPRRAPPVIAIGVALACICAYTLGLGPWSIGWGAIATSVAALGAALLARTAGPSGRGARWLTAAMITATASIFPVHESLALVRSKASDSPGLRVHAPAVEAALSNYLIPRTTSTKYELAVDEPLALAPLIIHDQRPILPLTSFRGRPVVGLTELRAAVRSGAVRYALIGTHTCSGPYDHNAACGPAATWVRNTGIDVSRAAGVSGGNRLYLLLPY